MTPPLSQPVAGAKLASNQGKKVEGSQFMTACYTPSFLSYSFLLSPVQQSEKYSVCDSLKDFGKSLFAVYNRNELMSYLAVGHSMEATRCICDLLF